MPQITLTREQLYQQVWSEPLSILAHKYMRTEMSLRTLCIEMSIPVPRDGHWEKIKAGRQINTPALSANYKGPDTITLPTREPKKTKEKPEAQEPVATISVDEKPAVHESMTATLTNQPTDKLILSAGKALRKKENKRYDGMVSSSQGELGIYVTPELVDRALLFMDTLIKALRVRGHDIIVKSNETCAVVFQQELKIHCRERTKRIATGDKWGSHVFRPSGVLVLKLDGLYGREWADTVTKQVDDYIPSMLDKFEEEARREIDWKIRAEQSRIEREEQVRLEKVRQQNHARELAASRQLLQRALRWEKSVALRNYINELEAKASKESLVPEDLQQYLAWARKKADWYDPFINAADEWLTDADKLSIEQPSEKKSGTYGFGGFNSVDDETDFFSRQNWYQK